MLKEDFQLIASATDRQINVSDLVAHSSLSLLPWVRPPRVLYGAKVRAGATGYLRAQAYVSSQYDSIWQFRFREDRSRYLQSMCEPSPTISRLSSKFAFRRIVSLSPPGAMMILRSWPNLDKGTRISLGQAVAHPIYIVDSRFIAHVTCYKRFTPSLDNARSLWSCVP